MKISKLLISLLLVLCMMVSLCACAGDESKDEKKDEKSANNESKTTVASEDDTTPSEDDTTPSEDDTTPSENETTEVSGDLATDIVGAWEVEINYGPGFANLLAEQLGFELTDADIDFTFTTVTELGADGSYAEYLDDEAAFEEAFAGFIADFAPVLCDAVAATTGYSVEELDEVYQEQYGCSLNDYFTDALAQSLSADDMNVTGTYELDGNTVTISSETMGTYTCTVSLDGDKLTVEYDTSNEALAMNLAVMGFDSSIVFTRK